MSGAYGVPPVDYDPGAAAAAPKSFYSSMVRGTTTESSKSDAADDTRECTSCGGNGKHWRIAIGVLTVVCVLLAVVFAIISAFVTQNLLSNQCYTLTALAGPVGPAGPAVAMHGLFQSDGSNRWFKWNLLYSNTTSLVMTTLALYGPAPALESLGPLATLLCGGSSPVNCGAGTTGTADLIYPGASSPSPLIAAIRANPALYTFVATPASGADLVAALGMSAGNCAT